MRKLQLGVRDSITGWYNRYWAPDFIIEMLILSRGVSNYILPAGTYVRLDAVGVTADEIRIGDEVEQEATHYEVKAIEDHKVANSFSHRDCHLTKLPLHNLSFSPLAPTVDDARYNMKTYLESRVTDVNLQNYNWIACYSDPDYPLVRVFDTKGIAIIFSIDSPESSPLMQGDLTPYGYEEHMAVHVMTLDTELNHLAEAELRLVLETYPTGSQRGMERRDTVIHEFGSTRVYDTPVTIDYRRDTT